MDYNWYVRAKLNFNFSFLIQQVIETKSSIAHKMAELENLQKRLKNINKETYRQRTDGTDF